MLVLACNDGDELSCYRVVEFEKSIKPGRIIVVGGFPVTGKILAKHCWFLFNIAQAPNITADTQSSDHLLTWTAVFAKELQTNPVFQSYCSQLLKGHA